MMTQRIDEVVSLLTIAGAAARLGCSGTPTYID